MEHLLSVLAALAEVIGELVCELALSWPRESFDPSITHRGYGSVLTWEADSSYNELSGVSPDRWVAGVLRKPFRRRARENRNSTGMFGKAVKVRHCPATVSA